MAIIILEIQGPLLVSFSCYRGLVVLAEGRPMNGNPRADLDLCQARRENDFGQFLFIIPFAVSILVRDEKDLSIVRCDFSVEPAMSLKELKSM
jgi:hypothetical protein